MCVVQLPGRFAESQLDRANKARNALEHPAGCLQCRVEVVTYNRTSQAQNTRGRSHKPQNDNDYERLWAGVQVF